MSTNLSAAPGDLELVRRFANTIDVEEGTDVLADPAHATSWLEEQGWAISVGRRDLGRMHALRDAIRELVLTRDAERALVAFDRVARAHPVLVQLAASPSVVSLSTKPVDAFVARILGLVATARVDGSWDRMKICANDACRWVYFDHSRNRSRTWCTMDLCGSRAKMRTYRSRRGTRAL